MYTSPTSKINPHADFLHLFATLKEDEKGLKGQIIAQYEYPINKESPHISTISNGEISKEMNGKEILISGTNFHIIITQNQPPLQNM